MAEHFVTSMCSMNPARAEQREDFMSQIAPKITAEAGEARLELASFEVGPMERIPRTGGDATVLVVREDRRPVIAHEVAIHLEVVDEIPARRERADVILLRLAHLRHRLWLGHDAEITGLRGRLSVVEHHVRATLLTIHSVHEIGGARS